MLELPIGSFYKSERLLGLSFVFRGLVWLHVVSATEKFLQPDVKADKKVTAAHLLNSEFGFAGSPVAPGDRNYCPRVSAHDRLERKLHGEVKVGSNERTASID